MLSATATASPPMLSPETCTTHAARWAASAIGAKAASHAVTRDAREPGGQRRRLNEIHP